MRNPTTKKEQRGASHAGFHFLHLYQCCQMKFFMKNLLRLEPNKTSGALISGSAFHEGKAIFYNTGSETKAIKKVKDEIRSREDEYEYHDQYENDLLRFPILLEKWIHDLGKDDLKKKEILGVEKEIIVPVPDTDGFVMTMRIDLIYRDNAGLFVMDTKTSSFSKAITDTGLYYGDQATAYLWAVEEEYDEKPRALIGDIAYWNKNAKTENNIDCYRTNLVMRSRGQIDEFKESCGTLFTEISQKVEAWKARTHSKASLFHRNTFYCNSYNRKCEYIDLCRTPVEKFKKAPNGFYRRPHSKDETLSSFTNDMITVS